MFRQPYIAVFGGEADLPRRRTGGFDEVAKASCAPAPWDKGATLRRRSAERPVKKSELAVGPLQRSKFFEQPEVPRSPGSVELGQEKGWEQSDRVIAY